MVPKTLLACALLACCLATAAWAGDECVCNYYKSASEPHYCVSRDECYADRDRYGWCVCSGRRRLLGVGEGGDWRRAAATLTQVVGCADEDEGTPCLTVEEVVAAVHNKVVNVTVLEVSSERPDPRTDAWEGQALSFFISDGTSALFNNTDTVKDVLGAVTHLNYCPAAGGNVLTMKVRLEGDTTFDGLPASDDLLPGTTLEMLVGHEGELDKRGNKPHVVVFMGNSAATTTC